MNLNQADTGRIAVGQIDNASKAAALHCWSQVLPMDERYETAWGAIAEAAASSATPAQPADTRSLRERSGWGGVRIAFNRRRETDHQISNPQTIAIGNAQVIKTEPSEGSAA